jgi:hypothetical protein
MSWNDLVADWHYDPGDFCMRWGFAVLIISAFIFGGLLIHQEISNPCIQYGDKSEVWYQPPPISGIYQSGYWLNTTPCLKRER